MKGQNGIDITIAHQPSTGQNVLRLQEIKYKNGIETSRKTAFLNVEPGKNPNKALEDATKMTWVFGPVVRQTGLNTVAAVEASEAPAVALVNEGDVQHKA